MRADDLRSLRDRVLAATGSDRELDLAIHLALNPESEIARFVKYRRGFDSKEGYAWDIRGECVCFEKHDDTGRCNYNGGIPLPRLTASLDAAVALCARLYPSRPTQGDIQERSPWVGLLEEGIWTMGYESAWLRKDFGPSDLPRYVVAACLSALIEQETSTNG